jgi:NADH-quinone oxidoreductase subunit N
MPFPNAKDLASIAPQLIVGVFGMLVLLLDAIWPKISKRLLANLTVLGLVLAGIVAWRLWPKDTPANTMQGMIAADGFTAFFTMVLVLGGVISAWMSVRYLERKAEDHGEYYALLLFTIMGGMVMSASINLICVFIGLEILSISLYILAGYQSERLESEESALKYFLLGAFASAFFLYGIALVYGATGTLTIPTIATRLGDLAATGAEPGKNFLLLGGIAMLLVGFGFKVAVVPFHVWTPDVYEGAPTSVTAFMSVAAKVAGFAAFLRFAAGALQDQSIQVEVSAVLASIAALTMLVGNVVAVVQRDLKRMLSYSSIAHAGYILTGIVAAVRPTLAFGGTADPRRDAISAVLFYTVAYTVSNLGAFGVILALRKRGEEVREIRDLAGVGARYPGLAALMALFLLSLAGLPPTAGFFGKLFLIRALVGMNTPLPWLIILLALTSVVSFYYYLGIVRAMYMDRPLEDSRDEAVMDADIHLRLGLAVSAIGTVMLGLWAGGALGMAQRVAEGFFGGGPFSAMR